MERTSTKTERPFVAMDRRRILPRPLALPVLLALVAFVAGCGDGGTDGGDAGAGDSGAPDAEGGPPTADEIRGGRPGGAAPSSQSAASRSEESEESNGQREGEASPSSPTGTAGTTGSETGASAAARPSGPPYAVQLGAFERESNAQSLRERLETAGLPVWTGETASDDRTLLRVRVGATSTVADARRLIDAIRAELPDAPDSAWIAPLGSGGEASEETRSATRALLENG